MNFLLDNPTFVPAFFFPAIFTADMKEYTPPSVTNFKEENQYYSFILSNSSTCGILTQNILEHY